MSHDTHGQPGSGFTWYAPDQAPPAHPVAAHSVPPADPYLAAPYGYGALPPPPATGSAFDQRPRGGMPTWAVVLITIGSAVGVCFVLLLALGFALAVTEDVAEGEPATGRDGATLERWSAAMPEEIGGLKAQSPPEQLEVIDDFYGPPHEIPRSTTIAVYGDETDELIVVVDTSVTPLSDLEQAQWRQELLDDYEDAGIEVDLDVVETDQGWLGCAETDFDVTCVATDDHTRLEITTYRSEPAARELARDAFTAVRETVNSPITAPRPRAGA